MYQPKDEVKRKMMQIVSTKKNIAMVVFTIGETIHFTTLEKYNPNTENARSPRFDGTFDDAIDYIHTII
jgi:hypothetical protein